MTDENQHFYSHVNHPLKKQMASMMNTTRIQDVLPAVYDRMRLDDKVQEMSVIALWPKVVEAGYGKYTKAVKIKTDQGNKKLVVQVNHGAIASELAMRQHHYLDLLNEFAPQTGLRLSGIEWHVR